MRRLVVAAAAASMVVGALAAAPRTVEGQTGTGAGSGWNDPRTIALVRQAVTRRAQQLADTGLRDYQADARGYLTFLAQLGEGFALPPKVVKADQLALEVYWRAPDRSKQRIIGRRDTTVLPTDIQYHRDHLGIIQNNFPEIIRLGDGDEVLDVPHPLSAAGITAYDFLIRDSLRITIPGRPIDVYEVAVRPKNDRLPRVIGAVFVDREGGQVVRMALSFTRAAFKDRQLEDLSVVLENGLVGTRFWLPRRQEIEIRRSGTWMDFPVRGIIRGRWEIGSYQVNRGFNPDSFAGEEIVLAPAAERARYPWQGRLLDSLPSDVRMTTSEEVARVQAEARSLVREQALRRPRGTTLAGRGVSEFLRVNRVEGLALGAGLSRGFGRGWSASARGRYGTADREAKGWGTVRWQRASGSGLRFYGGRDFVELGDEPEGSTLRNSIAAQEFGSDWTDPYDFRGIGVGADRVTRSGWRLSLDVEGGLHDTLGVHATPAWGRYEATRRIFAGDVVREMLRVTRPTVLGPRGFEVEGWAELRRGGYRYDLTTCRQIVTCNPFRIPWIHTYRAAGALRLERPARDDRLVLQTTGGVFFAGPEVPQELVYFGGPLSGPGYDFHAFVGRSALAQRAEWRTPVPFPSIRLGRFGRTGGTATLAPYVHAVAVGAPRDTLRAGTVMLAPRTSGVYPSVGVGLLTFFDLLRVDVARGLRDGRWTVSIDATRDFWRIL